MIPGRAMIPDLMLAPLREQGYVPSQPPVRGPGSIPLPRPRAHPRSRQKSGPAKRSNRDGPFRPGPEPLRGQFPRRRHCRRSRLARFLGTPQALRPGMARN
jgi:hypothetical protein